MKFIKCNLNYLIKIVLVRKEFGSLLEWFRKIIDRLIYY